MSQASHDDPEKYYQDWIHRDTPSYDPYLDGDPGEQEDDDEA